MISGVAGGMAAYLDIDPSVVRIIWALLVFAGGAGFLLYIVALIVIPEEPYPGAAGGAAPPEGWTAPPTDPGTPPTGSPATGGSPAPNAASWGGGRAGRRDSGATIVLGAILVVAGAWFLLRQYIPNLDDRFVWPSILVGIGIFLIAGSMRRR
jgi:phage shock protein PspC (stress-responsive transcriptional regulator)